VARQADGAGSLALPAGSDSRRHCIAGLYTGTGDANTDIGAHLAGFVCGFLAGMALTLAATYLRQRSLQLGAGIAAVSIIVFAWLIALRFWA
jgi:hypothetical protein